MTGGFRVVKQGEKITHLWHSPPRLTPLKLQHPEICTAPTDLWWAKDNETQPSDWDRTSPTVHCGPVRTLSSPIDRRVPEATRGHVKHVAVATKRLLATRTDKLGVRGRL